MQIKLEEGSEADHWRFSVGVGVVRRSWVVPMVITIKSIEENAFRVGRVEVVVTTDGFSTQPTHVGTTHCALHLVASTNHDATRNYHVINNVVQRCDWLLTLQTC